MSAPWTYHQPRFDQQPDPTAAWLGHRRFGYDLVRNLAPDRIVELGVCLGTSFFAFCQAVKDGGLSTELVAVDTWEGDEHTGLYGPEFLERFDRVWREHYARLPVRQVKATFEEARKRFAPGRVDILHLDGCHTYEAARRDFESWIEVVKPDGVVLLHDIAERHGTFGVYRLWDELKRTYPTTEFAHSHGLGVLFNATRFPAWASERTAWPAAYAEHEERPET